MKEELSRKGGEDLPMMRSISVQERKEMEEIALLNALYIKKHVPRY